MHPLAKAVQKHVLFVTLASYDSLFQPVPRLARWDWTADGRVLQFELRGDVTWHDGVPTRAHDVVWTLDMARRQEVAYPRARDLSEVVDVAQVDSLTVRVSFRRKQPIFPDVFTDLPILPSHRFAGVEPSDIREADFNRAPVGNGPFRFTEYRPNQRWVFERNPAFPLDLGRPSIERFVVVVVDEATTKLAALTSGELDFAGIFPAHSRFVRADPQLRVQDYPFLFVYALVWNLRRPLFANRDLRRALTMALDRQLLVDAYVYGFGTVAHGPVAPQHPWFASPAPIAFDPDGARALLDSLGWRAGPDGIRVRNPQRLSFDLLTVRTGDAPLEQLVQAQLRDVGVEVGIRQRELATFLAVAQAEERDFDVLVMGIPGDLSLGYVAAMFESRDPGPLAYPGYASDEFDRAVRSAVEATTEGELRHAWSTAQRILARDLPTTWLYHARGLQGANRRIVNASIDFRGELANIAGWQIDTASK